MVTGYEIGTIHTAQDVIVPRGTAVAGDIIGETIVVAGQVFGNLIAREIIIEEPGTVWGDIYARKISAEPGSTIRGWVNTLDEPTIIEYQNSGHPPSNPETQPHLVPAELQRAVTALAENLPPERAAVLNNLTAELAAARLARFELENSFENRLQTISGERVSDAEALQMEVDLLQRERVADQQRAGELTATLQQTQEALGNIETQLLEKEALISEQLDQLETLQTTEAEKNAFRQQLERENKQMREDLAAMSRRAEELADRINSLEAALKASNQRSAEQEQALIHWQELSELNELAAQEAKESLDDLEYSVRQNALLVENLQREKEVLARQLTEQAEHRPPTEPASLPETPISSGQIAQLTEDLQRKTKEVDLNKQALVESTAAYNQAARHIAHLENQLESLQKLEENRQIWEERIFDLDDNLELSELKRAKAERELAELLTLITQKDAVIEGLEQKIAQLMGQEHKPPTSEEKLVNEKSGKTKDLERLIDQLKTQHGQDIDYLNEQLAKQGQILAETRAALIDEQIQSEALRNLLNLEETKKTGTP